MGIREKLIGLEEKSSRCCTVTMKINGGNERLLYVENCRKIISCDEDFITLGIYGGSLRVSGTPLFLENFGADGIKISGGILSVEFTREA